MFVRHVNEEKMKWIWESEFDKMTRILKIIIEKNDVNLKKNELKKRWQIEFGKMNLVVSVRTKLKQKKRRVWHLSKVITATPNSIPMRPKGTCKSMNHSIRRGYTHMHTNIIDICTYSKFLKKWILYINPTYFLLL